MKQLFISLDWGTSSFRLRCIDASSGMIQHEWRSGEGIASVYQRWLGSGLDDSQKESFYWQPIRQALQLFPEKMQTALPIIISGMASSSIGIKMLPYVKLPCSLQAASLFIGRLSAHHQELWLVSGMQTEDDVLRGEETILQGMPESYSDGLVVLPGTHSKHVILADRQLADFRTFLTGELFELLCKQSTLSATVNPMAGSFHKQAFMDGLEQSGAGHLLNLVFHARTRQLLKQIPSEVNFDWLSGLLIGAEIRSLPAAPQNIILIAEGTLRERYLLAIEKIFPERVLQCLDSDACLVQGHCRIIEQIRLQGV